jgi:hypothetical protein
MSYASPHKMMTINTSPGEQVSMAWSHIQHPNDLNLNEYWTSLYQENFQNIKYIFNKVYAIFFNSSTLTGLLAPFHISSFIFATIPSPNLPPAVLSDHKNVPPTTLCFPLSSELESRSCGVSEHDSNYQGAHWFMQEARQVREVASDTNLHSSRLIYTVVGLCITCMYDHFYYT